MNFFFKIRKNLFSIFQTALIGLLVVLVVVFVGRHVLRLSQMDFLIV